MAKRELHRFLIESFGGGAHNNVAPIYQPDSTLPESTNVDFSVERGAASKRRGYLRVNGGTGLDGAVTGIYQDYVNGAWRNIICAGTKVYNWNQTTDSAATIETGMAGGKNNLFSFTSARTTADGHVIVMTNGQDRIRKYDGTTFTELATTETYNYFKCKHLAMFNNYCFFADTNEGANLDDAWTLEGGTYYSHDTESVTLDVGEVWNSTTELTENTATPTAPDSGEYGIDSNTLYVNTGGAPGSNIHITYRNYERVRWADIGNAEGYSATNFIDVVTSPGQEIRNIVPLRDLLVVYKADSIWAINYTGDSSAPFGLFCIDHNTKCVAGHSVADVKGEHLFLSEEGIMKNNGAKVDPVLVSKEVRAWFSYVSVSDWQYAYAATNEYLKQYRLLIPYQGATDVTDKDREVRYDYETDTWSVHKYAGNANVLGTMVLAEVGTWDTISRYWDEINVSWDDPSLWSRHTRFFTGDYNGYLRLHDQVDRDQEDSDQPIEGHLITKPLNLVQDLAMVKHNKRLHKLWIRLKAHDAAYVDVYVRLDREGDFVHVDTISLERSTREFTEQVSLSGWCREVEFKIGNNASLQPWSVYFLEVEYLMRAEN